MSAPVPIGIGIRGLGQGLDNNVNKMVYLDRRTSTEADKLKLHSLDRNVFKQEGCDLEGGGFLHPINHSLQYFFSLFYQVFDV